MSRAVERVSQRSLQNEPIFRLLLKVAVKGTRQCDFSQFLESSFELKVRGSVTRLGAYVFKSLRNKARRLWNYLRDIKARSVCMLLIGGCHRCSMLNLPGWCWAGIMQLALIRSSSSPHSEACIAIGASIFYFALDTINPN